MDRPIVSYGLRRCRLKKYGVSERFLLIITVMINSV